MGMFDSFYFKDGVLPDNKAPENTEFQTKDLDCCLDEYKVDKDGNVIKTVWNGFNRTIDNTNPINCGAFVYSHEFIYDNSEDEIRGKYLGCKYQEYAIMIVDSKLTHVKKIAESGYDDVDKSLDK